ncbi:hypothetical protein R1sor_005075 [Riccia sorocarpa]|uniref:Uncharacterized protein n=1 Tax=Riccia sorocarpa TaxID=122646 RepID=A0ABD3HM22_9MARC
MYFVEDLHKAIKLFWPDESSRWVKKAWAGSRKRLYSSSQPVVTKKVSEIQLPNFDSLPFADNRKTHLPNLLKTPMETPETERLWPEATPEPTAAEFSPSLPSGRKNRVLSSSSVQGGFQTPIRSLICVSVCPSHANYGGASQQVPTLTSLR